MDRIVGFDGGHKYRPYHTAAVTSVFIFSRVTEEHQVGNLGNRISVQVALRSWLAQHTAVEEDAAPEERHYSGDRFHV